MYKTQPNQPNQPNQGSASRAPGSMRDLLESTKLSRLPSLPKRHLFFENSPVEIQTNQTAVCVKCHIQLNEENQKTAANVCVKCLSDYALIDIEINRAAENKARGAWHNKIGGQK